MFTVAFSYVKLYQYAPALHFGYLFGHYHFRHGDTGHRPAMPRKHFKVTLHRHSYRKATLNWNRVPSAHTYFVNLRDETAASEWCFIVPGSSREYDIPLSLRPGHHYAVVVKAYTEEDLDGEHQTDAVCAVGYNLLEEDQTMFRAGKSWISF